MQDLTSLKPKAEEKMKIKLIILLLLTLVFSSCGQHTKATANKELGDVLTQDKISIDESRITTIDFDRDSYIHTEADYTDANGKGILIQNSYPRGGGTIINPSEMEYGHAVFWTRVVNKTDTTLKLSINLPSDSIKFSPSSKAHFKLLVPQDTMTLDKTTTFSFGLDNVGDLVVSNFYQPSQLIRRIGPNEESIFYIILLSHVPPTERGISRTGLFLSGQDLFYRLSRDSTNSKLIPCGRIAFGNEASD